MALMLAGVAVSVCGGCAAGPNKIDPWEKTNRCIYDFNDAADRAVLKPLADGYVKVVPQPVRSCIGNGFDNLVYFNVIFNDLLQTKWCQGLGDTMRMTVNSTIGIAGMFDVASKWNLPAHDNDFGVTLGRWGCAPGPYLVLPLTGPSCLRDAPGIGVEYLATPTTWLNLPLLITIPMYVTNTVDLRSRFDSVVRFRNAAGIDPYVWTRDAYLQFRASRISEGKPTTQPGLYEDEGDDGDARSSGTRPSTLP